VLVVGLFQDGALVELIDEPLDVNGYLRGQLNVPDSTSTRRTRSLAP
jgi:hypothetical protein